MVRLEWWNSRVASRGLAPAKSIAEVRKSRWSIIEHGKCIYPSKVAAAAAPFVWFSAGEWRSGRLPSPHSPSIRTNYAFFISYPTSWRLAAKTIGQRGRTLNTEQRFLPSKSMLDVSMRLKSSHPARVKRRGHAWHLMSSPAKDRGRARHQSAQSNLTAIPGIWGSQKDK